MPGIDEIVWVDFLIPEPRIISKNEVKDWEERFGYTLSEDFREVARKNQARRPKLEDKTAHDETDLDLLAGIFHFEDNVETDYQLGRIAYIEEHKPGALVFVDCSGDYMAFDYGENGHNSNPPIIYYNHEGRVVEKIADNVTDLLDKCLNGGWTAKFFSS